MTPIVWRIFVRLHVKSAKKLVGSGRGMLKKGSPLRAKCVLRLDLGLVLFELRSATIGAHEKCYNIADIAPTCSLMLGSLKTHSRVKMMNN